MAKLRIYTKDSKEGSLTERCVVGKWECMDKMMGDNHITFNYESPTPIDFEVGDWCVFRGETYHLNVEPTCTQKASPGSHGAAFTYENVRLDSAVDDLGRCIILDILPTSGDHSAAYGTNYTGSANFTLNCFETTVEIDGQMVYFAPVHALLDRIKANLDRLYPTAGWQYYIDDSKCHTEGFIITFNNWTATQALAEINNTFKLDFVVRGKKIIVGDVSALLAKYPELDGLTGYVTDLDDSDNPVLFGYGKGYLTAENQGKSLFQIRKIAKSDQQIITRLRAMGSTKNMPYRYYHSHYTLPQTMFVQNLQLPDTFLDPAGKASGNAARDAIYTDGSVRHVLGDSNDAYIDKGDDASTCDEGIREGTARWDGSDSELPEIYPTIEKATYGELRSNNVPDMDGGTGSSAYPNYGNTERLDEVLFPGSQTADDCNVGDGIMTENEAHGQTSVIAPVTLQTRTLQLATTTTTFDLWNINPIQERGSYILSYTTQRGVFQVLFQPGRHGGSSFIAEYDVDVTINIIQEPEGGTQSIIAYYHATSHVKRAMGSYASQDTGDYTLTLPDFHNDDTRGWSTDSLTMTERGRVKATLVVSIKNARVTQGSVSISDFSVNVGIVKADTSSTDNPNAIWAPSSAGMYYSQTPFHLTIKDIGVDFTKVGTLDGQNIVISMKSGMCAGREFTVKSGSVARAIDSTGRKGWTFELDRAIDDSIHTYYPSSVSKIEPGDQYVLLNIELPDAYIKAAEMRLLVAASAYLADNCDTKYTYQPSVDDIYLQRNIDFNDISGTPEKSVFWRLRSGMKFPFYGIPDDTESPLPVADITIEQVVIRMGDKVTPQVELTLNNDIEQGMFQRIQTSIDRIYGSIFSTGTSSSQSISPAVMRQSMSQYFLSKTSNDTANGLITFARGINVTGNATVTGDVTAQGDIKGDDGRFGGDISTTDISCMNIDATGDITADGSVGSTTFTDGFLGSGWRISNTNGNASMTLDTLTVRKTMRIFELLIQKVRATGGEIVVSPAYGKVERVEVASNGDYYLYIEEDTDDGMYGNMFLAGDYVRCQRWDKDNKSVHYYWARVSGVYNNRIAIAGYYFRDVEPEVGDELVLIGNSSNTARQSAITISATESGTPKITVLDGIKGKSVYDSVDQRNYYVPTLDGCTRVVLGDLSGITDTFFGNLNGYGLYSDNVYLRGTFRLANTSDWGGLLGLDDNIITYGGLTQGATGWTNFGATSPTFNPEDGGGWYIDFPKQSDTFTYGGIYTTEFTNRPKSKRKVRVTITYLLTGTSPSGTLRYGFRDASGNLLTTSSSYAAPQLSRLTKGTQSTISNDLYCPDDAARFFIESTGVFASGSLWVYKIEVKNILEDNIMTTLDVTNGEIRSEVSTVDGKVSALTQTVNGIKTDVTTIQGDYVKSSQLTQTANEIRSEVSALSNTVDGNTEKISQIEQTANGLTSTVTELSNTVEGNTQKISQIQQTADQISLEVAEKIGEGYELLEYPVEPDASSIWQRRWNKSSGVTFVEQDGGGYYAVFGSSGGYMTTAHLVVPTTQTKVDLYFKGVFVERSGDPQSGDNRYSITFDLCDSSNNVLSTYTRYCSYYYTPRDNGITVSEALTVMPSANYLRVKTSEGFTLNEVRIQVPNAMKRTGINIESGLITLSADNTVVEGNLKTHSLETIPDTTGNQSNKAKVKVEGSIMEVFGEGGNMNIRFGVDEDTGYAVLQYYDNDGTMLYDLGPNGLRYISVIEEKWELTKFYTGKPPYNNNDPDYSFHAFGAKRVNGIITSSTHASTVELATANNGLWFDGNNVTGPKADTSGVVVHKSTDSAENLNDTFLTDATTAQEYKKSVKEAYNFSDSDLSGITFTGRVIDGRFVLNKTTYVQRGHLFASGVRTTKYVIWQ